MAIADILSSAQGGTFYANVGRACGLDEMAAKAFVSASAPAIAIKLKDKAAADPVAFEALLDLLEEGGDSSDLDDVAAMTDAEAQADGKAILADLYGSRATANEALGVTNEPYEKAAALSATAVMATLAASNATHLTSDAAKATSTGAGGGLLAVIFAALLKGLLQGAQRQLAPKRRRRRYTYSTRRRTTTRRRRRTTTPGLDDVFRDILTGRR